MPQRLTSALDIGTEIKEDVKLRTWPAPGSVSVEEFLQNQVESVSVILDLRSPEEFNEGHIPGAINLPMLDEEAQAEMGRLVRCAGTEEALETAIHRAYPGLKVLLTASEVTGSMAASQQLSAFVYCKRGGARSQVVATFLTTCGLNVHTIEGGYKSFKEWTMAILEQPKKICIVGGACGSGKTDVLSILCDWGLQVIDLEALACHRGSVFGHLGQAPQPSSEHFRNLIAMQWSKLDPERVTYIEDEHACIGRVQLSAPLYRQMRAAPLVIYLDVPFDLRVARLLQVYGQHGQEELSKAVSLFQRRMGTERTQVLLDHLSQGELQFVCETALRIYDESYQRHLLKDRSPNSVVMASVDSLDSSSAAAKVSSIAESLQGEEKAIFYSQLLEKQV